MAVGGSLRAAGAELGESREDQELTASCFSRKAPKSSTALDRLSFSFCSTCSRFSSLRILNKHNHEQGMSEG